MVRKSPDKQWNRQNSILFHETIPLKKKSNLLSKEDKRGEGEDSHPNQQH
jgi:hypothetical protein